MFNKTNKMFKKVEKLKEKQRENEELEVFIAEQKSVCNLIKKLKNCPLPILDMGQRPYSTYYERLYVERGKIKVEVKTGLFAGAKKSYMILNEKNLIRLYLKSDKYKNRYYTIKNFIKSIIRTYEDNSFTRRNR